MPNFAGSKLSNVKISHLTLSCMIVNWISWFWATVQTKHIWRCNIVLWKLVTGISELFSVVVSTKQSSIWQVLTTLMMVYVMPTVHCIGETVDCCLFENILQIWRQQNKNTRLRQRTSSWQILPGAFYLVPNLFCSWILRCQRQIFKASLASLPLCSWEAPNNGIISDKVLRVAWPFLPLNKHKLKCVQLCMIPLQYFCLL